MQPPDISSGTNDFTIWDTTTGEVVATGKCVGKTAPVGEGQDVLYGERVNYETHVFSETTGKPILRDKPVELAADELRIEINRERQRRIEAGKDFGGVWVTGSDRDQVNLLALKDTARDLQAAGIEAAVIPFRDGNNVEHMMTAQQIIDLANAGKMYVSAIYQASWALKAMEPIPQDVTSNEWWP